MRRVGSGILTAEFAIDFLGVRVNDGLRDRSGLPRAWPMPSEP